MLSILQRWALVVFFSLSSIMAGRMALRALRLRYKVFYASSFVLMASGAILWMLCNGMGLLSTSIGVYDLFTKIDYLGIVICVTGLLLFSIQWSLRVRRVPLALLIFLMVLAIFVQSIIWTNDLHHWMWQTLPVPGGFLSQRGPLFIIHLAYTYLMVAASLGLLLRTVFAREGLFRLQAGLLLGGVLIPVITSLTFDLMGWDLIPMVDETAISLIFTVLVFAYVTLRFHAFELMPVANQLMMRNMREGVMVLDQDGLVVMANRAAEDILESSLAQMAGKPALELLDHLSLDVRSAWQERQEGIEVEVNRTVHRTYRVYGNPLMDAGNEPMGELVILQDDSERKELEVRLEQMAKSDPLIGCYNRGHFLELGERLLRLAQRYRRPLSLAMLDLDDFKSVNDQYGRAVGDLVLKTVATVCLANLRRSDVFARYGGEEFVVLLPETGESEARLVAQRLCEAIRNLVMEGGPVTASIGVVGMLPGDNLTMERLLDLADQALEVSKQAGRNRVTVWMD